MWLSPQSKGQKTANLTLQNQQGSAVVALSGTCGSTLPAADPAQLSFGKQRALIEAAPMSMTLTNVGGLDTYRVTAVRFSGLQKDWFHPSAMLALPLAVAPNARVPLDLTALPLATGPGVGLLELETDDAVPPRVTVPLSATGVAHIAAIDPPLGAFGTIDVLTKKTLTLALTNSGDDVLHVQDFRFDDGKGAFQLVNAPRKDGNGNWPTVHPGASLQFSVTFSPPEVGMYAGQVAIDTDDANQRHIVIPLSGNGALAGLQVTPAMVDFGTQSVGSQSPAQNVTVTNAGAAPLGAIRVLLSYPNPNQLRFEDPGLFDLAAGQSKVVPVYYLPLSAGSHGATLVITPAGFTATQVKLVGTAVVTPATVEVDTGQIPSSVFDFDKLTTRPNGVGEETDPQPIKVRMPANGLAARLERIEVVGSSSFHAALPSDPNLSPGVWNTFTVTFRPTVENRTEVGVANLYVRGIVAPVATVQLTGTLIRRVAPPEPSPSGCTIAPHPGSGPAAWPLLLVAAILARRRRLPRIHPRGGARRGQEGPRSWPFLAPNKQNSLSPRLPVQPSEPSQR